MQGTRSIAVMYCLTSTLYTLKHHQHLRAPINSSTRILSERNSEVATNYGALLMHMHMVCFIMLEVKHVWCIHMYVRNTKRERNHQGGLEMSHSTGVPSWTRATGLARVGAVILHIE